MDKRGCNLIPRFIYDESTLRHFLSIGNLAVLATFAFTLVLVFIGVGSGSGMLYVATKIFAFLAITALSLSYMVSTRLWIVERAFKGLDKAYLTHQVLGRLSLASMLAHPILLSAYQGWDRGLLKIYFFPGRSLYHTMGLATIVVVALLMAFTICFSLKYDTWIKTHRLMILALPLATIHSIRLGALMQDALLHYWVLFLSLTGTAAYFYKIALYDKIGPRSLYTVEGLSFRGDILEFIIGPVGKAMDVEPGQFIFLKFSDISGELHPFSVSRLEEACSLRISIKKNGDYTKDMLPDVEVGARVIVYGPYGGFLRNAGDGNRDLYFVAGGIGVTPFLSYLNYAASKGALGNIKLLWSVRSIEDAPYQEELEELQNDLGGLRYELWLSRMNGRVDAKDILSLFGGDPANKDMAVYICGPNDMNFELSSSFHKLGVPASNIHIESFALR